MKMRGGGGGGGGGGEGGVYKCVCQLKGLPEAQEP